MLFFSIICAFHASLYLLVNANAKFPRVKVIDLLETRWRLGSCDCCWLKLIFNNTVTEGVTYYLTAALSESNRALFNSSFFLTKEKGPSIVSFTWLSSRIASLLNAYFARFWHFNVSSLVAAALVAHYVIEQRRFNFCGKLEIRLTRSRCSRFIFVRAVSTGSGK